MGMRHYANDDYGLVLDEKDLKIAASKLCDDFNEMDYDDDPFGFIEELIDRYSLRYDTDFEGEAMAVDENGNTEWSDDAWQYDNDWIFYIPIIHYPSLFHRPYFCMNDIIAEFKENKIVSSLPEDFDIRDHFRHIVGTYYG